MATFNEDTAHEELTQHARDKTSETGITEQNKIKLLEALNRKEAGKAELKVGTETELALLKARLVQELEKEKKDAEAGSTSPGLTEQEIESVAITIKELSNKAEAEQAQTNPENQNTTPEAPKPAEPASPEITAAVAFFKEEGEFVETNTAPKETLGSRIGKYIMDAWNGLVIAFKEMI
jgi:hypothetical protein